MKQLTREWLNAAGDDLLTIESLLYNPLLTNIIAFHSQKAVEKTLKAIMEEFEISFIKTHNLQSLLIDSAPKSPSSLIFNFFTPAPKGELVENQRTLQSPLQGI